MEKQNLKLKKIGERELPSLCWWEDPTIIEIFEDEDGKIWEKFQTEVSPLGQEDNNNGN